jgi:hypothetical protein
MNSIMPESITADIIRSAHRANAPHLGRLTVREAARTTGLSEYEIRSAISRGDLPHHTQIVVTWRDLQEFEVRHAHAALDPERRKVLEDYAAELVAEQQAEGRR